MYMRFALLGCTVLVLYLAGGCVERTLSVQSNPPGALVYLNNEEVGRTPVQRDFLWYGDYEVTLRKDGYQTLKTSKAVIAPFYQWIPLDLISELLPIHFKDLHTLTYNLQAAPPDNGNEAALLARAQELRGRLASTKRPTTHPSK
jgi:hypothetical protein